MKKFDEVEQIISDMAKVKMSMNSHKGDISKLTFVAKNGQFSLLREELEELEQALEGGDYMNIIEEAADLHNYLLAAVYRATEEYRNRK